jgi:prevent-host-death family protein
LLFVSVGAIVEPFLSEAPMQIDISDVEKDFEKFIDALESGEETEIIITRNGKPAARLVPGIESSRRPLGFLDGKYPPMSLEDLNASNEEIAETFYEGKIFPDS